MSLSGVYKDKIVQRETFKRFAILYEDDEGSEPTNTTGFEIEGFIAKQFNSDIKIPLNVEFDIDRTSGKLQYSLSQEQIDELEVHPSYRFWIVVTFPTGDRQIILQSDSLAVTP